MQFFFRDSVPPPASFRGGAAEQDRIDFAKFMGETEERRSQTTPPARRFSPAQSDILDALGRLFRHKCAFCESKVPQNAHLFRPAEEAEPLAKSEFAHLYYAWLRTDWG